MKTEAQKLEVGTVINSYYANGNLSSVLTIERTTDASVFFRVDFTGGTSKKRESWNTVLTSIQRGFYKVQ